MKINRKASQMIEYLLMFGAVIVVILAGSEMVAKKSGEIVANTLTDLTEPIYTYSWAATACGPCSAPCGGGTQTCSYECQRSDGISVADSHCSEAKPADISLVCNTNPCAIDCAWAPWPTCPGDPNCGTCTPVCGTNRSRIETREIAIPAQYGGIACDPADGLRTIACADLDCTGVCGDGVLSFGEACDINNLGIYGSGVCDSFQVEADYGAGHDFLAGTASCYAAGTAQECMLNVELCEYDHCDPYTATGCGAAGTPPCPDGEMSETQDCTRFRMDGSVVFTYQNPPQCVPDASCNFNCAAKDVYSTVCPGWNTRLTSANQPWTYILDADGSGCPDPDATACYAWCSNAHPRMRAGGAGCYCAGDYVIVP